MTFVSGADQGDGLFLSVLTSGVDFDIDDHTISVDCFEQLAGSVAPRTRSQLNRSLHLYLFR